MVELDTMFAAAARSCFSGRLSCASIDEVLGVSQCDLHTATSNQHSSRCPEVAAGSVAGIHPNQRHPRGAVDRISPSRELKGRVRETYDVDFTEHPPKAAALTFTT